MIDLKELQAAMDRCAFDSDVLGLSKSECASLLSMLREAEKDAARYRFIRDESTDYHIGEFFSTEVNDRDDCIDSLIEQLNLRMNRLKAKAIIK